MVISQNSLQRVVQPPFRRRSAILLAVAYVGFLWIHLAMFNASLLESWLGPLHFLWLIGCGFGVVWAVWRGSSWHRGVAVVVAGLSVLSTAGAAMIPWAERGWGGSSWNGIGFEGGSATPEWGFSAHFALAGILLWQLVSIVLLYGPFVAPELRGERIGEST